MSITTTVTCYETDVELEADDPEALEERLSSVFDQLCDAKHAFRQQLQGATEDDFEGDIHAERVSARPDAFETARCDLYEAFTALMTLSHDLGLSDAAPTIHGDISRGRKALEITGGIYGVHHHDYLKAFRTAHALTGVLIELQKATRAQQEGTATDTDPDASATDTPVASTDAA